MHAPQPLHGSSRYYRQAIERTIIANDRILLSFTHTALYFAVAGRTLTQFISVQYGFLRQLLFFAMALFTFLPAGTNTGNSRAASGKAATPSTAARDRGFGCAATRRQ